jgi:hypothetical protein
VVPAEKSPHAKAEYDAAEFEGLVGKYDGLKWRMISKPGGATVKPDDFYRWAAQKWGLRGGSGRGGASSLQGGHMHVGCI